MTKKLVFIMLVLLVAVSSSFGQLVSPPSNVVGYVKIDIAAGGTPTVPVVKAFGLPFKFWFVNGTLPQYGTESTKPSSIVGTQANQGVGTAADRVVNQRSGAFASRNSSGSWTGGLETASGMIPGDAYYFSRRTAAALALVLAGQVDNATLYTPDTIKSPVTPSASFNNPVSWRDSRDVIQDDLNLLASGFQGGGNSNVSDRVITQAGTGAFFWRRSSDNTWQTAAGNPLTQVNPGVAYWIQSRHQGRANWLYQYNYSGASIVADPNTPSVSSIKNNTVKTVEAVKLPQTKITAPVTKSAPVNNKTKATK